MDQICLVLPVLPGRAADAHAFLGRLDRDKRTDYGRSERHLSITKEAWFAANADGQEVLVAYIEAADFARATELFSLSRDPFDRWFKDELAQATGIDLNEPPELVLPKLLSSYSSDAPVEMAAEGRN